MSQQTCDAMKSQMLQNKSLAECSNGDLDTSKNTYNTQFTILDNLRASYNLGTPERTALNAACADYSTTFANITTNTGNPESAGDNSFSGGGSKESQGDSFYTESDWDNAETKYCEADLDYCDAKTSWDDAVNQITGDGNLVDNINATIENYS